MKQLLLAVGMTLVIVIPALASPWNFDLPGGHEFTQNKPITGKVTNDKGEPLVGVTVQVKGLTTSATTDADGVFTIDAPQGAATLVFSYVGMDRKEVSIGSKTDFQIQLTGKDTSLDDVVVVGYGTQRKSHLTGAVESIKSREIEDLPLGNLGAALSGRMLGLEVSGGTSRPGSTAQLTIRNPLSLAKDGGNNNPLYVIDDVIQVGANGLSDPTLFNSLDPSEVESVTILKDASAAIYGSRASNGVVIVKTKRGKEGKPRITYSGSYAVNDEAYRTKMLNADEMGQYINIMNGPNGDNRTTDPQLYFFSDDELAHYQTINNDWLDDAWKASSNMRHTFNLSGGAQNATYFANVSYYTQDGNLGRLDFNKWTFRAGADVSLLAGLKAGLQVSGNYQDLSRVNSEIGGENAENDYRNLLRAPRYVPTYIDGFPVRLPGSGNNLSAYHFFELDKRNNYIDNTDKTSTINLYAEYELPFLKGFKARVNYARNMSSGRSARIGTKYLLYGFTKSGTNGHIYEGATNPVAQTFQNDNRIRFSNTGALSTQLNLSANYSRQFGLHSVNAMFIAERTESESNMEEVLKDDPVAGTNGQLSTAFGAVDGRSSAFEAGTLGYIGRASYGYDNKYLVDFMFRTDASTKFSPDNYWGSFYSLGVGWVISDENFFKSDAINFLKLRYSVGLLGKDDTRAWQWRQRYTFQNGRGAVFGDNTVNSTGIKMEVSPNPDASWSNDFKQNLGLDARFLKSRLSATLEGFYNRGTDMLIERTDNVPVTVGGSIASENWGAMDFFGYEMGLGWKDNIGNDFSYGIDTRFTWYDNKVKQGNFNPTDLLYPWNKRPGESNDNGKWGYDYLGMFRDQGEIDTYVQEYGITQVHGVTASALRPGMLYYRDVRGPLQADGSFGKPDGVIDNNDQIQLAKKATNHYGFGMTLKLGYKGFAFDAVIGGSWGGWSEFDARTPMDGNISTLYQNVPAYWNNIYDPIINPAGKYPNPGNKEISLDPVSNFWKTGSFRMRMRNLNLNYTLGRKVTQALRISNARIALSCVNPMNFYNPYDYRDSEAGWDVYPVLRTYSLGVNLTL